jgi:hypothetical protein
MHSTASPSRCGPSSAVKPSKFPGVFHQSASVLVFCVTRLLRTSFWKLCSCMRLSSYCNETWQFLASRW